ncbi:MAG: replicative DNA helicase [Candidatus Levybacteria bacterium]|nr:replicative DNA helicase [Candidatus Levybacteria bacterium]
MKARILPHNRDAEQSVLGAIFIDKDAIGLISALLSPKDFYDDMHAIIYEAMLQLYEDRKSIDILTITAFLKKKKLLDKIDASYLTDLVNGVPTAANIEQYAQLIKEAATKRFLIQSGTHIVELGFDDQQEIREIIDAAESSIFSISQGHTIKGFIHIKDSLAASFDKIDELHKKGAGLRGIKTGFMDLDNTLSGLQNSNLIILAARPGQGKTAMAVNIAQHVGVVEKQPVAIFSLEMSQEELVDRLLVGQADVDAWRLKTGKLNENDFSKLSEAMGQLADAKIYIDDTPGITVSEMRTKARRLQMEHGISLVIVDYLQLVNPGRRYDSRVQEVGVISQAMKNLARELKVPVIALSQLSRAIEHRAGDKRPQLADLRESGSIEQDADVVMFLYRPEDEMTPTVNYKLLIAKHRNGATGEIDLLFRGDRIKFYSMSKARPEESPPPTSKATQENLLS